MSFCPLILNKNLYLKNPHVCWHLHCIFFYKIYDIQGVGTYKIYDIQGVGTYKMYDIKGAGTFTRGLI